MKRMFREVAGPFMTGIVGGFFVCLPIMIALNVNRMAFWHWGVFLVVMLVLMAVMFWRLQSDQERRTCWRCREQLELMEMILQCQEAVDRERRTWPVIVSPAEWDIDPDAVLDHPEHAEGDRCKPG